MLVIDWIIVHRYFYVCSRFVVILLLNLLKIREQMNLLQFFQSLDQFYSTKTLPHYTFDYGSIYVHKYIHSII